MHRVLSDCVGSRHCLCPLWIRSQNTLRFDLPARLAARPTVAVTYGRHSRTLLVVERHTDHPVTTARTLLALPNEQAAAVSLQTCGPAGMKTARKQGSPDVSFRLSVLTPQEYSTEIHVDAIDVTTRGCRLAQQGDWRRAPRRSDTQTPRHPQMLTDLGACVSRLRRLTGGRNVHSRAQLIFVVGVIEVGSEKEKFVTFPSGEFSSTPNRAKSGVSVSSVHRAKEEGGCVGRFMPVR
jgi:hypothetical protein